MSAKKPKSFDDELMDDLLEDQELDLSDQNKNTDLNLSGADDYESSLSQSEREAATELYSPNKKPSGNDDDTEHIGFGGHKSSALSETQFNHDAQLDEKTVPLSKEHQDKDQFTRPVDFAERTRQTGIRSVQAPSVMASPADSPKVRTSVGRVGAIRTGANAVEMNLAQSEALRIAQARILELEGLLEKERSSNEELLAAAETLKKKADQLLTTNEKQQYQLVDQKQVFEDERVVSREALKQKDREIFEMRQKIESMDARLAANMQKVRVRERELENRLEMVKMESSAVIRSKNEMILDLKRDIDQLNMELENYRSKGQDLNKQLDVKDDALRRTVKTLRLALTMLEGANSDDSNNES